MQRADWKRPWCWERLKEGGERGDRGWDDWLASPTEWTWVWVSSWSWWWREKPGVLQSMGSQRVRHDWATKLNMLIYIVFVEYSLNARFVSIKRLAIYNNWIYLTLLKHTFKNSSDGKKKVQVVYLSMCSIKLNIEYHCFLLEGPTCLVCR